MRLFFLRLARPFLVRSARVSQSRSVRGTCRNQTAIMNGASRLPFMFEASAWPLTKRSYAMLSKSKILKSTVIAALVGLAGIAAVTPASARSFDSHGSYHRDRDSGWSSDRGDRHDHSDRHDRSDRGWGWRYHNRHHFHGWY
jgi:hypothetical protein